MPQQIYEYSEPSLSGPVAQPQVITEGQVFRAEVGETLLLPCRTRNLGNMILLWKKGTRVLTAGVVKVRRDHRIKLEGTDLQISKIESDDAGEYVCEVETDDDEPIAIMHSVEILGKFVFNAFV